MQHHSLFINLPPLSIYTSGVERGNVRVKCLIQEHNTLTQLGLEPRPLDHESSAQTQHIDAARSRARTSRTGVSALIIRSLCLPH